MAGWSLVLPLLKYALSLEKLVRLMGSTRPRRGDAERTERILQLAWWTSRLQPWRYPDNCLERSLVAYRFLGRSGADPRLVMGMRRGVSGLEGHVWVELDARPALESVEALEEFTRVVEFGTSGGLLDEAPPDFWRGRPARSVVRS